MRSRTAGSDIGTWNAMAADADATRELGRVIGATAPDGAVILLEGPLGAGKTTLAQGIARGCGVQEHVTSPTFNLILHYRGRRPFTHVDLYRLSDPVGLATLDIDEIATSEGVTCVEWPELAKGWVVPPYAEIVIERAPHAGMLEQRRFSGRFAGSEWESARAALEAAGVRFD